MKVRFKFRKTGRLKYIGHLDLLNIWNRAVKSAKLPVSYSNGFNPHMLVSFAAPLPLGMESVSEYVDIDFGRELPDMAERINARFPAGLEIIGVYKPPLPYTRVAAAVARAEYRLETPFKVSAAELDGFLSSKPIEIMKRTKRSNIITDISPDIFDMRQTRDNEITAVLACGSAKNLKPTLLLEAFSNYTGSDSPLYQTKITRTEIFAQNPTGQNLPLWNIHTY